MKLNDARETALTLMREHGLIEGGWRFEFDGARSRFGLCNYRRKVISLSHHLVTLNDEARVRNTILHEIAHALVGPRHGHDRVWRRKAVEIGCNGERCYGAETERPEGKYTAACPRCERLYYRHKRPSGRARHACPDCCRRYNGNRFTTDFQLDWRPNDGRGYANPIDQSRTAA